VQAVIVLTACNQESTGGANNTFWAKFSCHWKILSNFLFLPIIFLPLSAPPSHCLVKIDKGQQKIKIIWVFLRKRIRWGVFLFPTAEMSARPESGGWDWKKILGVGVGIAATGALLYFLTAPDARTSLKEADQKFGTNYLSDFSKHLELIHSC